MALCPHDQGRAGIVVSPFSGVTTLPRTKIARFPAMISATELSSVAGTYCAKAQRWAGIVVSALNALTTFPNPAHDRAKAQEAGSNWTKPNATRKSEVK
jgi:hypothetical protein